MKGKIVLVPFPFTDLTATKLRPALVLFEGERDVVVVFISSKVSRELGPTDIVVDETHPDFKLTGLKAASVIRLDKVATISKEFLAIAKSDKRTDVADSFDALQRIVGFMSVMLTIMIWSLQRKMHLKGFCVVR